MDVGNAAGDRVLDRDHGKVGLAGLDRVERVLEGRARQRFHARETCCGRRYRNWRRVRPGRKSCSSWLPYSELVYLRRISRARSKIFRGVHAKRHRIDHFDVDAHAGFQRAQLFETLALFERRRWQRHETLQRRPPISVEPNMMVKRALAPRRSRAGEIERLQPVFRTGDPTIFTTLGLVLSASRVISTPRVAISTAGSSSGLSAARIDLRIDRRQDRPAH